MKKSFWILGVLTGCLLHSFSASADVIWEPQDSFYQEHSDECTYVNRQFTANGPDGSVVLYKSPEMPIKTGTWENGYQTYISFIYTDSDGIEWGVYDGEPGGWMPMAYMEVVYDSTSFMEEHIEEIVEQQGELDSKYHGEIYLWKYPGSEDYQSFQLQDYQPYYQSVYVDEEGHSWGWIGYYFGMKDVWVCLDQPAADFEQLYPEGILKPGESVETSAPEGEGAAEASDSEQQSTESRETERIVPKMNYRVVMTAVIMVVLVVLVTVVFLIALRKRFK